MEGDECVVHVVSVCDMWSTCLVAAKARIEGNWWRSAWVGLPWGFEYGGLLRRVEARFSMVDVGRERDGNG